MMSRHQLPDSAKQRLVRTHIAEGEMLGEERILEASGDGGMLEQRLDLGGECEYLTVVEIVKRLDPQPVPRAKQGLRAFVPDGEGEHAAEMRDAIRAVLLVGVNDGFGVAAGLVMMTPGLERRTDIGVIKNFAVVNDPGA